MTRLIRVMGINAQKIVEALLLESYEAKILDRKFMPSPEAWIYRSWPGEDPVKEEEDLEKMVAGKVPLQISCSGKTANKIINRLKEKGLI